MKKLFLSILPVLLFIACKSEPIKTETRVYELTFIDDPATKTIKTKVVETLCNEE